ncbi:hypothetical protein [Actinomadura decatromicini]|uniref:Uncharacterized protein n=1 Tax=Actinomadura decatromicini TaxID=2604572 RepID=A0A5D3FE57_9ACTN|nr:hypothetical protein [Actinomadura decatromicini]TYK46176.1 hypothetical protein FXF68_28725 [Actinomadura decatromicini]
MRGDPVDPAVPARRERLFSPEPRLGWVFRDRFWFLRPFPDAPPHRRALPEYLARRAADTERLARRRLRRTLPVSLAAAAVFALVAAFGVAASALPPASPLLCVLVAVPGAALTALAVRQREGARRAHELAQRQNADGYQEEARRWQARRHAHETAERARLDGLHEWGAAPRRSRRLDVFGGTLWAWEAFLTTYGTSALAVQPLLVLDLSREVVSRELVDLARTTRMGVDAQLLPSRQASSGLLTDLSPQDLVDAIVESMHGGTPDAARAERSMDGRILSKVCDALGDRVTLGRIAAALRVLMGEPDDGDALTREERRRIASDLFTVEYRRQAHANLSRIESYLHPLENLGTEPTETGPGYLTCVALDSQARNVRSELLTDLIVQWVTHRVTASRDSTPAVIVAGADELARRHLERLSDACERRGVPLTLLFRRLRETSAEMIGGGAVAFMRLGNHEDAARAADFIGREHRFVLSQITKNVGGNESHTTTGTEGESDSETTSTGRTTGTSSNWGTSRSSGSNYSGGEMFGMFPERSTSYQRGRNQGGSTSTSYTEGTATSTSRNWSAAYAYAEGTNWSDADTTQRVYEYAVEPVTLQHLPDHALLLVESAPGGGRTVTAVECDPAIITLERVSTAPLPDAPPRPALAAPGASPAAVQPAAPQRAAPSEGRWAAPPSPPPPRAPLTTEQGPPPGYRSGPRPPEDGGPPPLFGGG